MKLSDYVFGFLKDRGAKHVFMLPGGGAMHLVDSLGNSGLDYVCFQHEQGAAIAAEAYGQHTNKPGIVLTTSGPGATNAITGVTAGWIDSTPMFLVSGQAKRADLVGDTGVRQIGSQEVQIVPMVEPITKYAVQVMEPTEIRYHMEKAWYLATTGRPGPVWLSIPLDVQAAEIEPDILEGFIPDDTENTISAEVSLAAEQTLSLLSSAEKPLVLLGNGIKLAGATDKALKLIHKFRLPAQTTWKTIDMLGEEEPLYAGHPGGMGDRGANLILQNCDLLISIGSRLDTSLTAFNDAHFAKSAKKVIVDIDPHELARMKMKKDVELAADAGVFLDAMLEKADAVTVKPHEDWLAYCLDIREQYPVVTEDYSKKTGAVSAFYFVDRLSELLKNDDVIVPESSGGAGEITYQAFKIKSGQKMKNAAGLGSMGFGLPYAIGSCIANDRRRTILINGEGAFQLNVQELETLHRLQLPVKMFIWNNGGYVSIRNMQNGTFAGHHVACDADSGYTTPDCRKVAEAYGFATYHIKNNIELDDMLPKLLTDDNPLLCVLDVDPTEGACPRCKAHRKADGGMESDFLEDMWPHIGDVR